MVARGCVEQGRGNVGCDKVYYQSVDANRFLDGQTCYCLENHCNGVSPGTSIIRCHECTSLQDADCGLVVSGNHSTCTGWTCVTYFGEAVDGKNYALRVVGLLMKTCPVEPLATVSLCQVLLACWGTWAQLICHRTIALLCQSF
jgi:hypothetical protein